MTSFYEIIKKYKLASSEGINKYQNRMIRYEQLYKACVISDEAMIETMSSMIEALSSRQMDSDMEDYEKDKEDV